MALLGALAPIGSVAPALPAAATIQSPLSTLVQGGGFAVPKVGLLALAALPPTGIAGLNLQATGNLVGMVFKVLSYGISIFYALRLNALYPSIFAKIVMSLMFLGPWYVFDILSYFDPAFDRLGFQPPIPISGYPKPGPPVAADGTWRLTPALIGIIMTLLPAYSAGLTSLINFYVPGTVGGNIQNYMGYAAAGAGALGLALTVFSATRSSSPVAPAPSGGMAPLASSAPLAAPPPLPTQAGGAALPPLSSFVKDLKRSASPQAFQESTGFLALLGLVVAGGLALGFTRAKETHTR